MNSKDSSSSRTEHGIRVSRAPADSGRGISRRDALRITAAAGVALAFGGRMGSAVLEAAGVRRRSATRVLMATPVTITALHSEAAVADAMVGATFAEMSRLEAILTRHRPDSPVTRLARDGSLRDAPPELIEVLSRAHEFSAMTNGAFDITVAPLLDLYRGSVTTGEPVPAHRQIEDALALVDYRAVRLEGREVSFDHPGMAITLDGIAKGYIVDSAVSSLVRLGAERVLVDAGGDMAATTEDNPAGWEVVVQDPRHPAGSLGVLRLGGGGVASSGDYVQAFTQDRSLHHILDPRTGRSPTHTSAVTVTAPSALDADALATAAFVLGPEKGVALLAGMAGVEGMIVAKDGREFTTPGLRRTT